MATQKRPLPDKGTAKAQTDRTILDIFDAAYQGQAFNPDPISGSSWGDIGGTLSDQTDLQTALNAKVSLTDYTNITVVDSNGKGDFTTLSAAIAAVGTSDLIVIFGSLAAETITLTTGTYTLWLPSYRTNASITLTVSGASVIIAGSGRMTGTINLTSGSLTFLSGVRATTVNVTGGTLYGYQPYISTVNLNTTAAIRIVGGYISDVRLNADMNTTGNGSYLTHCYLAAVGADVPRTNVPIFNCTFGDPPYNVALASGNYSNVAIGVPSNGSTWPAIP